MGNVFGLYGRNSTADRSNRANNHRIIQTEDKSTSTDAEDCIICYNNKVKEILLPCGHICICNECKKIMLRNSRELEVRYVPLRKPAKPIRCPACNTLSVSFTLYKLT